MTLIEVLVALTILALAVGLALGFLGPWLSRERSLEREGGFWQASESAQTALTEITAGAIDPARRLSSSNGEIDLATYVPRLAATPIDVRIYTQNRPQGGELWVASSGLGEPDRLLNGGSALRVSLVQTPDEHGSAIVVEARVGAAWSPVIVAPVIANAQPSCRFDLISQACR